MKLLAALGATFLLAITTPDRASTDAKLWEYRNLGKAFYENPDTHQQSADVLKKAMDLSPRSIQEQVNYALALLRAGQIDQGAQLLQSVQKQDPKLPHTWFNLGIYYKHAGDYDHAIEQFKGMVQLEPGEPAGHYNLAAVYRSKGDATAAVSEFLEAERLNPDLSGPHFQLFTLYQRAHETEKAAAERQKFEQAKKRNEGAAVPEDMEWCYWAELYDPPEPRPTPATPIQYSDVVVHRGAAGVSNHLLPLPGAGAATDLLVWSKDKATLLRQGRQAVDSGLEGVTGILDIAAADYNNDGKVDLCVLTESGATLFTGNGESFSKGAQLAAPNVSKAVFLDFDHDNDVDLLLFGTSPVLYRNANSGQFEAATSLFPFVAGPALDAVVTALRGDTAGRDLLVTYADRPAILYRDKLNGNFEKTERASLPGGSTQLAVQDLDHDGLLDVVAYGPKSVALHNVDASLVPWPDAKPEPWAARADFNGDGREDLAVLSPDGSVTLRQNKASDQHWIAVAIQGVKNPKQALNATVEVKAGPFYDKRLYTGVPLSFSIGDYPAADTVRITWPNGLIQNETGKKPGELLRIEEAQRLSGSCPMIFTWDGTRYRFITDVLGVAPLGASAGDGHYFPVDHDEYVQIPGSALKTVDGKLRLRITEELHEVSYLDQVQLIAVDHPNGLQWATNDKFKSPPYPDFRLFGSAHPLHAKQAVADGKSDVTDRLRAVDGRYPDNFRRTTAGIAEPHTLDIDFGRAAAPDNHGVLVLNGWVDWADGSTFLAAAQSGHPLQFPSVQVRDAHGKWQTVVADMGIPSGKPKTIAVDMTGKFLSADRSVRIVTNLCVYWDEIALYEQSSAPSIQMTRLNASAADLHFRGFSEVQVDPERKQPERFNYDQVHPVSNWNPTAGVYTRYGDVQPLVTTVDDKLLIMGSGDEVTLEYSANGLPVLPWGWTRDYLLLVDGWAKDADANTAFSQTVEPLPFHAMSAYPYRSDEHFPDDAEHRQYRNDYLTRPGLRLIRPLMTKARRPQ